MAGFVFIDTVFTSPISSVVLRQKPISVKALAVLAAHISKSVVYQATGRS